MQKATRWTRVRYYTRTGRPVEEWQRIKCESLRAMAEEKTPGVRKNCSKMKDGVRIICCEWMNKTDELIENDLG